MRSKISWLVAAILALSLATMLLVAGLSSSEITNDALARDPVGNAAVPQHVRDGGTVVDATKSPVESLNVPDRTIALTFDDGPDPQWTPKVLEVLRKHDVGGTFFVVGSMAARHPELIRQIRDSGSELAAHSFTHPDLAGTRGWRFDREMHETQLALVGGAGVTTRLFRPPFSSSPEALDDPGYRVVREAGQFGYVSVFTDLDSDDWNKPGVDAIVRNSTPENGEGGIVLLHDAGGDRSQTVAALDVLIPKLQAQGYRFTTVSEAVGLPPGNQPAQDNDTLAGSLLVGLVGVSMVVVTVLKWALIVVGGLTALRLMLLVVVARRHARQRKGVPWGEPVTDPVTVIVPAYNESANIESTVRSALASNHDVEVIVVDDGSTDGTADLVESLGLPRVRVIRQPNSGKAAALNTGIATASHELIVMVDGDTVFQPDTVHELVQPFADAGVGAVAANVKIANRDTFLTRLQHIEYVIGFNVDRRVYDLTRSMPTIPGAGGAFRRSVLRKVGGLSTQTLAEDTDLTIAIGRAGWRIVYQDTAVTWTEAPTTVRQLARQRFRWTFGTMQAMWKHRRAILQRGASGRMGRFGLLHVMAFQIVLPLTAPVIDIFLVYGLLFLNPAETLLLWTGMLAIQAVGGFFAFKMDGERTSALWLLPAQQLVYRQLMYLALVQSMTAALSGIPVRWQRMRRTGFFRQRAARPVAMKTDLPTVDAPAATASVSMTPVSPGRASTVTVDNAVDTVDNRRDRPGPARERWLDVLRAVALARVVLYHTTGWGWLSIVFPAMGVMFAAGGSLATKSMTSRPAVDVVGSRIRRLLPPLWVLGIVLVPLMLLHGWSTVQTGDNGQYVLDWAELLYWIFPIFDPPSSDWSLAVDATAVLWYVRAYLWFVLLTPMLVRAFRRRPVVTLLAPLALVALNTLAGSPLAVLGPVGSGVEDFGIYGACWVLGIAHRDGVLKAMSLRLLLALAAGAIGLGGWWAVTHSTGEIDLNDIPLAQALICAGVVPLLLRGSPSMAWLDRTPGLGRLVTVVNSRAITLYLWHNVAIALAVPVNEWLGIPYSIGAYFGMSVLLTAVAVLSLGWVEDIAARRPLQFLPGGPKHDEPRRRPDRNLVGAKS